MKNNYDGGICDPNKAVTCGKDHCYYKGKGTCMHTTRKDWMKERENAKSNECRIK